MARKKKNAGVVPLTLPQTREEHYLANIAGLVGTKPEYPFNRTERYLDAISSNISSLATDISNIYNSACKYDNKIIHTAEVSVVIPASGTATPIVFEENEVDTIIESVCNIPNEVNTDAVQGYGMLTDTGAFVVCQAFIDNASKRGYCVVATISGTPSTSSGTMIIKYTLVDGT